MTGENVIIGSAITSMGIMGTFLFLSYQAKSKYWKNVWLIGVFLMMAYALGIDQWSFQHLLVANDLSALAFQVLNIILWLIYIAIIYLLFLFVADIGKAIHNIVTGVSSYGKTDEKNESL